MFEAIPDESGIVPLERVGDPEHQTGRRHLSERQAENVERLVEAAAIEVGQRTYAEISVRSIAKRAGVAPATAYTYFSSKDHLLAEVLWRRVQSSPYLIEPGLPLAERVARAVRSMGLGAMDSPAVSACTTALLADGPDVMAVRARIGREIAHRLRAAWPEADPAVLRLLQLTYSGAMLNAGLGHLPFDTLPGLLAEAATLLNGGAV